MGLILGGILAGAAIVGLAFLFGAYLNMSEFGITLVIGLALLLAIVMIFMGIFEPVNGYGEATEVSTTKLITLRDDTVSEGNGNLFYVSISGTNSYTYYTEIDSEFASGTNKAYKSNTISGSNITIIEDDNYTEAKLVTYVRKGKVTFWTFAVGAKEYEYVFYVPTGTIARDVSLG